MNEEVVSGFSLKAFACVVPLSSEVRGVQPFTFNSFTDVKMRSTGRLNAEYPQHLCDGK